MEPKMKEHLEKFFKLCYARLDTGNELYGNRYKNLDLFEQIEEELADVANYALMQYIKIIELKEKASRL